MAVLGRFRGGFQTVSTRFRSGFGAFSEQFRDNISAIRFQDFQSNYRVIF